MGRSSEVGPVYSPHLIGEVVDTEPNVVSLNAGSNRPVLVTFFLASGATGTFLGLPLSRIDACVSRAGAGCFSKFQLRTLKLDIG